MRGSLKSMLPPGMRSEEKAEMFDYMQSIYRDPKAMDEYMKDSVFSEEFWTVPSMQVTPREFYSPERGVDTERFLSAPEDDMLCDVALEEFTEAADTGTMIKLERGGKVFEYSVESLPPRYVWKSVRFGFDTGNDAAALDRLPTYVLKPLQN